jgi:hypothetical protein
VLLGALIAFQGFCTHTSAPVPRRLQISPPARH